MGLLASAGGSMCWRVNCGHRRRADRGPPHLVGNHGRGPCLSLHLRAQGRARGCGRARWLKLYKLCVCVCGGGILCIALPAPHTGSSGAQGPWSGFKTKPQPAVPMRGWPRLLCWLSLKSLVPPLFLANDASIYIFRASKTLQRPSASEQRRQEDTLNENVRLPALPRIAGRGARVGSTEADD